MTVLEDCFVSPKTMQKTRSYCREGQDPPLQMLTMCVLQLWISFVRIKPSQPDCANRYSRLRNCFNLHFMSMLFVAVKIIMRLQNTLRIIQNNGNWTNYIQKNKESRFHPTLIILIKNRSIRCECCGFVQAKFPGGGSKPAPYGF